MLTYLIDKKTNISKLRDWLDTKSDIWLDKNTVKKGSLNELGFMSNSGSESLIFIVKKYSILIFLISFFIKSIFKSRALTKSIKFDQLKYNKNFIKN